ncbi:MAG: hypothetical protein ABS879_05440 [Eubacteriales bacterium]
MQGEQNTVRDAGHPEWIRAESGANVPKAGDDTDSSIPAAESNLYIFYHYQAACTDMMGAALRQADSIDRIVRSVLKADDKGTAPVRTALPD